MQPNIPNTKFSPSSKVAYATTNYVAFLEKESLHGDFHSLMDFLKNSPISYALTASPPIYAEIVQEMWSTADCSSTRGGIKCTIKGNSYIITHSVINEALHLPHSNFENTPTQGEITSMLKAINYAGNPWSFSRILEKNFRKEWSYFFDTLNKCFAGKCNYATLNIFVMKIAYSILYGRRIDIGELLLNEFSYKLGDVRNRDPIIYYPRFLMIIANHLCKELSIADRHDTLQIPMQTKKLFDSLVKNNYNAEVEFVLPEHVRAQLSTLYSSPSDTNSLLLSPTLEDVREGYTSPSQVALPSPYQSVTIATSSVSQSAGKRKRTISTPVETRDGVPAAPEVHLPPKQKYASKESSLSLVDQETPAADTRDGVPAVDLPSATEEENPIHDLLVPAQELEDRQHLLNAASVLKSQLVARLTSSANKLSTKEMIILANKCYTTLQGLGDDFIAFSTAVNQLISQQQLIESFAEKKENWNEQDIKARHDHQVQCLSEVTQKLHIAKDQLCTAKTIADSLKLKREELTGALLKVAEEFAEVEERVQTLTAERDQCKEAHSVAEAELGRLDAENKEARLAYREISDKYKAANEEYQRMSNRLLRLLRK